MPSASQYVISGLDKLLAILGRHSDAVDQAVGREIRRGAKDIATTAKLLIAHSPASGRVYWMGKNHDIEHHASAPGEPPATNHGQLIKGITAVDDPLDPDVAYVVSRAPYSFWLEFGTERMEPRPFLYPAYRQHRDEIVNRVRAAAREAYGE